MMPQLWAHTNHSVYLGVLLLRCVYRATGRPCVYKTTTEAAETGPGQFACDLELVLKYLPPALEYRGNQQLEVRIVEKGKRLPEFRFATGLRRTGERPKALRVSNPVTLVDPRTAPDILDLGNLQ